MIRWAVGWGLAVMAAGSIGAAAEPATPPATQPTTQPRRVVLTEEGLRVHRGALLIDGHNDLPWQIRTMGASSLDKMDIAKRLDAVHTDIPRLRQGGVGAQFWVVYAPPETARDGTAARVALEQFDLIDRMIARYADVFEAARTADDVERIHKAGRIACLIGIEGGHVIENSLDKLAMFHRRGARYLGLTHSETTDWADSATDVARHGGLSPFGERVVAEMNRLGMLVDLAHVSPDTMRDAIRVSRAPVIVSHAAAMALASHPRNVPDDVLRLIARNGGLVMVTFFPGYAHPDGARAMADYFEQERVFKARYADRAAFEKAWKEWRDARPIPAGTVGMVADHIDHIVRVAGVEHVGIGSDYDGVDRMPLQLEDVSGYPFLTQELLLRGYAERDIRRILGGNMLRVLRDAERIAEDGTE